MRSQGQYEARIEAQGRDWQGELERRCAKASKASAKADRKVYAWLERFKPRKSTIWSDFKIKMGNAKAKVTLFDPIGRTNVLLLATMMLVFACTLGLARSTMRGGSAGFIDLLAIAAAGLLVLLWVRRVDHRRPI